MNRVFMMLYDLHKKTLTSRIYGLGQITLYSNLLHYHYFMNVDLQLPLLLLYFLEVMHYITIT